MIEKHYFEPALLFLEGDVNESEARALRDTADEANWSQELGEYKALLSMEHLIASDASKLDEDLSEAILSALEQHQQPATYFTFRGIRIHFRQLYAGMLASQCALLALLAFMLFQFYPAQSNPPGWQIPEGYSMISLEVPLDQSSIPAAQRYDLEVNYTMNGTPMRSELARFIPVVDSQAVTDSALARSRLLLLVPNSQLETIQRARLFGQLALSPIQLDYPQTQVPQQLRDPEGRFITAQKLLAPAVIYYRSAQTRQRRRLVRYEDDWIEPQELRIEAF